MKKSLKRFCLITTLLLIFSIPGISYSLAEKNDDTITIVFTHDLHDHIMPYYLDMDNSIKEYGGFARIQSVINSEREKDPQLLLLDAGDFSMGTLFQTVFSLAAPSLSLLGKMGFDATTLGNHEFDFRAQGLADSLRIARQNNAQLPELLTANITFPQDKNGQMTDSLKNLQEALNDYGSKEYTILERKGIKIGVFGIMGVESASNAPMSEVVFTDPIQAAQRIVKVLKEQEKTDLIICLSHSGTSPDKKSSEDEILAQKAPGIDIIISGHSHTKLLEPIVINDAIICSTGEYGENIGLVKVEAAKGHWQLKDYRLLPITDSQPLDSDIAALIDEYKQKVQEFYLDQMGLGFDEILAYSPQSFIPAAEIGLRHQEEPLANLIGDAYIYAVERAEGDDYQRVDAAVVPSGTIRSSFVKGHITVADTYAVSSLGIGPDKKSGYPLISVYLTGKELKTACEVDASIAPLMNTAQLYIAGLKYSFNPHRLIFNKLTQASLARPDGTLEAIDDSRLYRVIAGLYSAQMLSVVGDKSFNLLSLVPKDQDGVPIEDFEKHIIKDLESGTGNEIKEWEAIAQYLQSFEMQDGLPQIPAEYYQTQGRKVIINDTSIPAVYGNPNKIALTVYSAGALLILAIIFLLYKLHKYRRRKNLPYSA